MPFSRGERSVPAFDDKEHSRSEPDLPLFLHPLVADAQGIAPSQNRFRQRITKAGEGHPRHSVRKRQQGKRAVTAFPHPKGDRKSTRLNSSHVKISYAVFCLKKKKNTHQHMTVSLRM